MLINKYLILFINFIVYINFVNGIKKGTTFGSDDSGDLAICNDIKDLNVAWYYNWGLKPNCVDNANLIEGVQFIPTIWGKDQMNSLGSIPSDNREILFTFNEPNYNSQGVVSPSQAADYWSKIQALNFKKIVGPSMADCPDVNPSNGCNYGTNKWYVDFLAACSNCKVDYANIHIYNCDADDVMNKITKLYNTTGLKIWLTEFNCGGASSSDQVLAYAKKLIPMLEESPIVAGYSWFLPFYTETDANAKSNSLYQDQSGKGNFTPIGEYYAGFESNTEISSSDQPSPSSGNIIKFNISIILLLLILLILN